jgi:hypothetical protein
MGTSSKPVRRGGALHASVLLANAVAVLVAFALVWVPEVRLYWTGFTAIDDETVSAADVRPTREVLDEIATQDLGIPAMSRAVRNDPAAMAALAQDVLSGRASASGYPAAPLAFPFRASNLEVGLPRHQLLVASMASTRILLHAYRATNERRYLQAALDEALAFARVDERRLIPRGLLWNDHALATRIAVLAELWSLARGDPALTRAHARTLLGLADRTAALLAKPDLYTYRTNHGVMQNIALLQFAAAFPALPRAAESRAVGCRRLEEQMTYYVNPDGIALEHSAGYHELGRHLLEMSVRLFELNGCEMPADWRTKLEAAIEFSRLLTRPDLTLPVFGNTDHAPLPRDEAVEPGPSPARDTSIYPAAGYAVWWHGLDAWPDATRLSQTVVTWSNYPTRAHKLADDMSVLVWAGGRAWLTNTGYWPYGVQGYDEANGWRGSNAPHMRGEGRPLPGTTTLRRAGQSPGVRMLELERQAEGGVRFRRQIVEWEGFTWVVVDSVVGPASTEVDTVWTTMPASELQQTGPAEFSIVGSDRAERAHIRFLGGEVATTVLAGELHPFGGWVISAAQPTAAPSIEVRRRSPGTVVTVLSVGAAARWQAALGASVPSADGWTVVLGASGEERRIRLGGDRLVVSGPAGDEAVVPLEAPARTAETDRRTVLQAYESVVARYPGFRELTFYRWKLTVLMLGLLIAQEIVVGIARRWSRAAAAAVRGGAVLAWLSVGLWAYFVYLR